MANAHCAIAVGVVRGGFSIVSGTVTSNFNITNIQAGIKNSAGAWVSGYPVVKTPNAKSYNLSGIDAQMLFNKLPAGSYTVAVVATDASAKTVTGTKAFTVTAPAATTPMLPSAEIPASGFCWPVPSCHSLSSWYGYRVWKDATSSGDSYHNGIDIGCGIGTPVYAANGGKVYLSKYNDSTGHWIIIQDSNGYCSVYMHLSKRSVEKDTVVKKGQLIGYSGNTGGVPAHLHLEIRRTAIDTTSVNPISKYQLTDTRWNLTNPNPVYFRQNGKMLTNTNFNYNFLKSPFTDVDFRQTSSNPLRDSQQIANKVWTKNNFNNFS
jgi:murein DD-endopeptidase MepM/ murein hydrolase activator NlpD